MKKTLSLLSLIVAILAPTVWAGSAIPPTINYQGTLKEKTLPATGTKQMIFRITDQLGTTVYWSSGQIPVPVSNGLFSAQLKPVGVAWDQIVPYIEVTVETQLLLPREPVSATVYANVSATVVDASITRAKLDSTSFDSAGVGLVPPGAIMMFAASCPAGWNVFSALQGRFPVGADAGTFAPAGSTGGALTHTHSTPDHQHAIAGGATIGGGCGFGPVVIDGNGHLAAEPAGGGCNGIQASAATTSSGSGTTGSGSSLPPYLSVVFCQKL